MKIAECILTVSLSGLEGFNNPQKRQPTTNKHSNKINNYPLDNRIQKELKSN